MLQHPLVYKVDVMVSNPACRLHSDNRLGSIAIAACILVTSSNLKLVSAPCVLAVCCRAMASATPCGPLCTSFASLAPISLCSPQGPGMFWTGQPRMGSSTGWCELEPCMRCSDIKMLPGAMLPGIMIRHSKSMTERYHSKPRCAAFFAK